jgi:serine/threonine-protein kinase
LGASDIVDLGDPPGTISGMRTVLIDGQGRLLEFQAVPPQVPGDPGADAPRDGPDWAPLFAAADLPMGRFTPVAPEWTPRAYADRRAAWEGPLPGQPDVRVRVEAAAFDGRVVSFQTIGPWSRASRMQSFQPGRTTAIISAVAAVLVPLVVLGSGILARRNVRAGRGDRGGALRVAGFIAAASLAGWAVTAHHVPGFAVEIAALLRACGAALLAGGMVWLLYLALEPAVRRTWPDMLIGWTRLLAGGLRDPRVGRDVLIGVSAGVLVTLLAGLHPLVPPWLGLPAPAPHLGSPDLLLGAGAWTAVLADVLQRAARYGMLAAFVLVVLRRGVRAARRERPVRVGGGLARPGLRRAAVGDRVRGGASLRPARDRRDLLRAPHAARRAAHAAPGPLVRVAGRRGPGPRGRARRLRVLRVARGPAAPRQPGTVNRS